MVAQQPKKGYHNGKQPFRGRGGFAEVRTHTATGITTPPILWKIDLKDAYVVVPIHPESKRFFFLPTSRYTMYRYSSLILRLSGALRIFSKLIMRYAIEPLRKARVRLVYCLDDLCLLNKDEERSREDLKHGISTPREFRFPVLCRM
jgi:hypothetical protein